MDPNMDSDAGQVAQLSPPGGKHAWFTYSTGDRPLEGYTIKRGIGAGGFGEVYYAVSDGGKEVALKQIQRHLDVELRGVSQCLNLKHPNLVVLYDVKRSERGENWVVMEFVSGENLAEMIERYPQGMPVQDVLRLLRGICDGVGYLHQHGIVHRDLKPGNIFIENDLVKIGDYGLAKFISASRRSGQTESVGTVHYMAPELAHGRYGKEIDLYAVGIILHEMLTGRVPFAGQSPGEILMKHLTAQPDTSVLPRAFQPIVARLLAKAPEQRYPSFEAMLADLDDCLAGRPSAAAPVPPPIPAGAVHGDAPFRTPLGNDGRRVPSLPFWMDEVHAGFSTAEGLIRFTGDALALNFRVKPLGMVNMALQEIRIPIVDLDSVQLREGWLTTKMLICANRPQALANLPATGIGQTKLRLARSDRQAAREFVAAVTAALGGAQEYAQRPVTLGPPPYMRAGGGNEAHAGEASHIRARTARLVRPRDDRVWLGVCSGLAARIGIDPVPIRLLWVLLTIFSAFMLFPFIYVVLALVMPETSEPSPIAPGTGRIKRLVRPRIDRQWAGVCSGIATYFGIDPVWIRIAAVVATVATAFLPGLFFYLILCLSMPEGEPGAATRRVDLNSVRSGWVGGSARYLGRVAVRLPIALACGGGVGAIVGATCQVLGGQWHDEPAALLGVGSGLITGGIMLCALCRSLGKPHLFWPMLATLLLGGGAGLITGGLLETVQFADGSSRDMVAAFGGVGAGLIAAAFVGYLLYSALGRALGWRWLFVVLYLGGGAGFVAASCGTILGANDPVVALSSVGAGLLTAGGLTWLLALGRWAERLRPVVVPAAGSSGVEQQNLKQTMTWYGPNEIYRPVVLGTSLFLTVLLVAWSGAYGAFWLAGSRQPLNRILSIVPPPTVVEWEVNRFGGHRSDVYAVAFDSTGRRLATGDTDGVVKLWNLDTNTELRTFSGHTRRINSLAFSPDGGQLAAAADCLDIRIWDVETGESTLKSADHPGPVNCVAFSPDGTKIATGCSDDAVRLFDSTTGQLVKQFFGCKAGIESVAFLPDGARIMAVGHNDSAIRTWDIRTGRQLKPLSAPNTWLSSFVISTDGRRTAARDFSGSVYLWETSSGQKLNRFSSGASSSAHVLAFNPDGSQVLCADWPDVRLHDIATGRVLCRFKGHTGSLTALAFHPEGDFIVTAGSDNTVRLWEVPANFRRPRISLHDADESIYFDDEP